MALDLNRLCDTLFAYLYKHYKNTPDELPNGLPIETNFVIPENFPAEIGDCQILINKFCRPYCQEVYQKVGQIFVRGEKTFSDIVKRRCSRLRISNSQIQFLIYCAIISEMNFHCFQQGCYRFAGYAPRCLADVIATCSDDLIRDFRAGNADGAVEQLKNYCEVMLFHIRESPDFVPDYVEKFGAKFVKMQDMPPYSKVVMVSPTKLRFSGESTEKDAESAAAGCAASEGSDLCKLCKTRDCVSFLRIFETNFNSPSAAEVI